MTRRIKIFCLAAFLSLPVWWGINLSQKNLESFFTAQISQPFTNLKFIKIPVKTPAPGLDLSARAAISLKIKDTGRQITLFRKDSQTILPIASLSKLMTAVIVLENPQDYDLSRTVKISKEAASQDLVPQYGNLKEGEQFTVSQLLDLMLIYSSNHAAYALAEVSGIENFINKMNKKSWELLLPNTSFANPTGLDPIGLHYNEDTQPYFNFSTARDLASLINYIINTHPLIFSTSSRHGPFPVDNGISEIVLPQTFTLVGGKTGYTDEAGGCMILLVKNDSGETIINIIIGAPSAKDRVIEMQKLIDFIK